MRDTLDALRETYVYSKDTSLTNLIGYVLFRLEIIVFLYTYEYY
jgi:hypothetical protein